VNPPIVAVQREEVSMDSRAERYAKEPVRYPALHVVDLAAEGAAVTERSCGDSSQGVCNFAAIAVFWVETAG
jgi:hypothetical protein